MSEQKWQKPSARFCNDAACAEICESGACAEVAWKTPCESAHCLETNHAGTGVLLRASGAPDTVVTLTREEFSAFVGAVKAGEYDGYVL